MHQIDDNSGRFLGAAVCAITGASVGHYQNEQSRELERTLAAEHRAELLDIERHKDETLTVTLRSDGCLAFDSSEIQPALHISSEIQPALHIALGRQAAILVSYDRTILHIIGHRDSIGTDDYDQALSNRRAQGASQYSGFKGVATERPHFEGRGESDPRQPNDTSAHRVLNRRVEINISRVVEGNENRALIPPAPARLGVDNVLPSQEPAPQSQVWRQRGIFRVITTMENESGAN